MTTKRIFNKTETIDFRRRLRKDQTDAERKLWSLFRQRGILGYKFFRQFGIESFIVDFYCPKKKLAIELDGGQHYRDSKQRLDQQRDAVLLSLGVKTLRFSNVDVLQNIEGVLDVLENELRGGLKTEKSQSRGLPSGGFQ